MVVGCRAGGGRLPLCIERHLDSEVRDGRPGIGESHTDRKGLGEEGAYLADRSCVVNAGGHIRNIPWRSQLMI